MSGQAQPRKTAGVLGKKNEIGRGTKLQQSKLTEKTAKDDLPPHARQVDHRCTKGGSKKDLKTPLREIIPEETPEGKKQPRTLQRKGMPREATMTPVH